jgi:hypothetical protein
MQNNLACKKRCLTNIGYCFITPFIVVVQLNRTLARENQKSPLVLKEVKHQYDKSNGHNGYSPSPHPKKKNPKKYKKNEEG